METERAARKRAAAWDGVQGAAADKDVAKRYHRAAISSRKTLRRECGTLLLSVVGPHTHDEHELYLRLLESTLGRYVRLLDQGVVYG